MIDPVSKLNAVSEMFVHYTYFWYIRSIQVLGLLPSEDGHMGNGIYCCRANDQATCNNLLAKDLDWVLADKHFPSKGRTIEAAMDYIHPIYFEYSGSYFIREQDATHIRAVDYWMPCKFRNNTRAYSKRDRVVISYNAHHCNVFIVGGQFHGK